MFLANLFIFSGVSLKRQWPQLVVLGISGLTPYHPCMTFDNINASDSKICDNILCTGCIKL